MWKLYKRAKSTKMRPVIKNDIIEFQETGNISILGSDRVVSISDYDRQNGSPKEGDMIAKSADDRTDQWLVNEKYFLDNFKEV